MAGCLWHRRPEPELDPSHLQTEKKGRKKALLNSTITVLKKYIYIYQRDKLCLDPKPANATVREKANAHMQPYKMDRNAKTRQTRSLPCV